MNTIFSEKDKKILRALAAQQAEIANSPKMEKIVADWKRQGVFSPDSRPMVTMELWTFQDDILPPLMQCEGEEARRIEQRLLSNIVNHTLFDDDTVVNPYQPFSYGGYFMPFHLDVKVEHTQGLGHHFISQIVDLEEDFHKLQKSTYGLVAKEETHRQMEQWNELFGDILPAKRRGSALGASPMQNVVHIMSMEDMFMAMYDYPELFHQMMKQLSQDYIDYFHLLADENYLGATTAEESVGQGTYCFTDKLPAQKEHFLTTDVWGYMDSQETSGLSPEMYEEFVFPYYKKISDCYGMLSYGCCEAVDPIWENCLSKLGNLGRVSISPWCKEAYMGEQLRGKKIIYLRKPTPNLIGVGSVLDEDAVRAHFKATAQAARGCQLEIVQRDVYHINNTYEKVRRYVQIIREEVER